MSKAVIRYRYRYRYRYRLRTRAGTYHRIRTLPNIVLDEFHVLSVSNFAYENATYQ